MQTYHRENLEEGVELFEKKVMDALNNYKRRVFDSNFNQAGQALIFFKIPTGIKELRKFFQTTLPIAMQKKHYTKDDCFAELTKIYANIDQRMGFNRRDDVNELYADLKKLIISVWGIENFYNHLNQEQIAQLARSYC